ncbi:hypothetical protein A4P70_07550, partial [Listeria monocytogenes]|uniref:hypothetical protein n=2 Tax=Listeria monocytogenes TaxID=1639 RepID=UPI000BE12AA9
MVFGLSSLFSVFLGVTGTSGFVGGTVGSYGTGGNGVGGTGVGGTGVGGTGVGGTNVFSFVT